MPKSENGSVLKFCGQKHIWILEHSLLKRRTFQVGQKREARMSQETILMDLLGLQDW